MEKKGEKELEKSSGREGKGGERVCEKREWGEKG